MCCDDPRLVGRVRVARLPAGRALSRADAKPLQDDDQVNQLPR